MLDTKLIEYYTTPILNAMQRLEEIDGPESEEYIWIMNEIIQECKQRIETVQQNMMEV